jgi:hypothetical protein
LFWPLAVEVQSVLSSLPKQKLLSGTSVKVWAIGGELTRLQVAVTVMVITWPSSAPAGAV